MRISISLAYKAPLLHVDNPGGTWLQDKQAYNKQEGNNRHGSPKVWGAITASWDRQVLVPVSVLSKIHGMAGERTNVRSDDLAWLTDHMSKHKRLPLNAGKHYVPYVMVWQDGTPWVNEGNHRILAAAALKYDYLPVQIRYFTGGEAAHGLLSPDRVRKYDAEAFAAGNTLKRYAK